MKRPIAGIELLALRERFRRRVEHEADTRSVRLAAWLLRVTKGRVARLWHRQVLILTTRGRRSGLEHTVPLQFFPDGGDMVVLAANSGMPSPGLVLQPHRRPPGSGRGRGSHAARSRGGAVGGRGGRLLAARPACRTRLRQVHEVKDYVPLLATRRARSRLRALVMADDG